MSFYVEFSKVWLFSWQLFENINKFLLIWATLNNFCAKNYEKTYRFYDIFQSSCYLLNVHKILLWKFLEKKNGDSLKMLTSSYKFQQLWTTFARKLMKRPTIFMTYFHSSDQFVHVLTVLLAQKFLQKKWHLFQYVKKMLLIPATLNNILNKNYEKFYRFCNIFSKFLSLFTLSHNVIMATFLEQKWQLFQCC